MSKIFEALKHAQSARAGETNLGRPGTSPVGAADRRRGRRWTLDVRVQVYGHGPGKDPFHEETHTLNVNAHGALLLLSVPVRKGQKLLLTNLLTHKEQDCLVVYLGTRRTRTIEAGIAFPDANPAFWQLPAPPEDKTA